MNKKILIVEEQFVEANDLQLILKKAGYIVCGIARSVPIAMEMIKNERPDFVLLDIFLKGKLTGVDLAKHLRKENIAFIYLSANSNEEILSEAKTTEPYGFIVKPFREKDLLVTLEIAQYRHEHSRDSKYRREIELIEMLDRVINEDTDWKQKLLQIGKAIQPYIPFDFMAAGFDDSDYIVNSSISFLRIAFNEYQTIGLKELSNISGLTADELTNIHTMQEKATTVAYFNNEEFENIILKPSIERIFAKTFNLSSLLTSPVQLAGGKIFTFSFYSRRADAYNFEHIGVLNHLHQTISRNIEKLIITENDTRNKNELKQLNRQATYDRNNASASEFEGIIGKSHLLLTVFDQITQVAPFDTAVLILGESGTGKERVADCIHNLSPRKGKSIVKVNCATLPATLIESELFGHEKGAFTGATDKRIGKFEQANEGTIFLDEIGEMPVDMQVKLLRVLQEKEIEPIGGRFAIKINVRVIAATNRNLEKEVADGRFRLDLYYRLNVFPITLPPLSERIEDIPALAHHFISVYNRKTGKKITGLSDKVLKKMMSYHWPGNIRELENLMERSVLMAKGATIDDITLPVHTMKNVRDDQDSNIKTIQENEREYIINVLKKCNGKIWGVGGAAEVLKVPPSTLKSKMIKLGIQKGSEQ